MAHTGITMQRVLIQERRNPLLFLIRTLLFLYIELKLYNIEKMKVYVNDIIINDVKEVALNDCELSLIFKKEHTFSSIEGIEYVLNQIGLSIGNFYFKGVPMWDYYLPTGEVNPILPLLLDEDGRTDVLCVIPQYLRENFTIIVNEN